MNCFNLFSIDYLKFWINTIVTYCKGSGAGFPKIIIVLTHKDKVKAVSIKQFVIMYDSSYSRVYSQSDLDIFIHVLQKVSNIISSSYCVSIRCMDPPINTTVYTGLIRNHPFEITMICKYNT